MVHWTPEARADVANIHAYIAQHASPAQASTVVRAITARANLLDQFKGLGKAGSLPHTREYKVARLPYIIVYTVRDEDVVILRIWRQEPTAEARGLVQGANAMVLRQAQVLYYRARRAGKPCSKSLPARLAPHDSVQASAVWPTSATSSTETPL